MQGYLGKKQELRLRNYGFKTIKACLSCLREYFGPKIFNLKNRQGENKAKTTHQLTELVVLRLTRPKCLLKFLLEQT
jgi:hypothetical protein